MAKRVLLAACLHESNSFNRYPAGLAHFNRQGIFRDDAVGPRFAPTRTEMGGFLAWAAQQGWSITTPLAAQPASAGPVAEEAYTFFRDVLHDAATKARKAGLDGVLLALHGAMVAEGAPGQDGDGGLAQAVRDAVGPDMPIAISLDPHGNVSDLLAGSVNAISAYRTHPHTDHFETGQRAAAMLTRALAANELPQVHLARRPMLRGFDGARTETGPGPMHEAMALSRGFESVDPEIYEVSIQAGFSPCDTWHTGPTAAVTARSRGARFQAVAETMMDYAWDNRGRETFRLLTVAEALEAARNVPPGPGPIVISDYGDAPGGGAYGDATAMLSALLQAGLPNVVFAGLKDPEAVAAAEAAGIGGRISVALGGRIDPRFGGGPVPIVAEVQKLSDGNYVNDGPYAKGLPNRIGATALLRVLEGPGTGMRIMVNALARNVLDRAQLRLVGLTPEDCNVLCIKGMDAIRAAFQPGSRAVIPFESGGIASRGLDFSALKRIRRPVWPLDANAAP